MLAACGIAESKDPELIGTIDIGVTDIGVIAKLSGRPSRYTLVRIVQTTTIQKSEFNCTSRLSEPFQPDTITLLSVIAGSRGQCGYLLTWRSEVNSLVANVCANGALVV